MTKWRYMEIHGGPKKCLEIHVPTRLNIDMDVRTYGELTSHTFAFFKCTFCTKNADKQETYE